MELESEEADFQVVMDKPEPNFAKLAAAALDNARIGPDYRLQHMVANAVLGADAPLPAIVEADDKEVIYEMMFDHPDVGLGDHMVPLEPPVLTDAPRVVPVHKVAAAAMVADINPKAKGRQYLTQAPRSAVGNTI